MNFKNCVFCPYFNQERKVNSARCASVSYFFYCSLRSMRCVSVSNCRVWRRYYSLYLSGNKSISAMVKYRRLFYKRLWAFDDCEEKGSLLFGGVDLSAQGGLK